MALKFLAPAAGRGREGAARLLREAQAASALDHPNIATIFDIDEHDGQPFIVMAYYEGETLAEKLGRGPLPAGQAARVVAQVAGALAAAHEHGIVHPDLKPSNVIVTTAGQVKVLDFGIAKIETDETSTRLTGAGSTIGTAAYMSPEQAVGEPAPDAVFAAYRSLYSYDHGDLEPKVDAVDESMPDWRVEKVSYAAAYGEERIPAYLYIPRHVNPPYQTLVAFPGSGALSQRTSGARVGADEHFNWIMRSGRALFFPAESSQQPLYDLLGTPPEHKRRVVYDTSHTIPRTEMIKEIVDWLDRYWGAAQK